MNEERGINFLLCESLIGYSDERKILENIAIKPKTEVVIKYENMPNSAERIVQVAISRFDEDDLNVFIICNPSYIKANRKGTHRCIFHVRGYFLQYYG